MSDPRVAKLARVLVQYSLPVKAGDIFRVTTGPLAAPLVREVVREALQAGAFPRPQFTIEDIQATVFKYASDEQLKFIAEFERQENEEVTAFLNILASHNTKALSGADPKKVATSRQARRPLSERFYERDAKGELTWCITQFPTQASAQDADMSLEEYEDFVYGAGHLGEDDPVAAWQRIHDEQQQIADFLGAHKEIRLVGPDTDLTYHTAGRSWINADGRKNFPDGEVFTSPDESKTQGHIRYTFPAVFSGREVEDVRLWFENGRVVKATAAKGEEFLHALLEMDEGARRLGEAAFGTNYNIQRFTRNILFDEKIGGTVHLALGSSFAEVGGQNKSALHWDMICDMRQGGEAYADGKLFYKDGQFLL